MSVSQFVEEIESGKLGKNIGISTGLLKLDSLIFGIQRRYLYLIGSDSGSGKSSFGINIFLYNLLTNRGNKKVNILLYSFEMGSSIIFAKLMSLHIWNTYKKIITYEEILSLINPISETNYEFIKKSISWLKEIEQYITIYDKALTPSGIYATCKEWLKQFGTFEQVGEHKENYIDNYPESYKVVVCDHLGLIAGSDTKKIKMDTVADYFIYFRNKCAITGVFIQQLNRNSKSVERKTNGYELLDSSDLSDSSGPAQASEVILLLYYPYREKVARVEGYPIQNVLKHRFRLLQCVKNRFGRSDINIGAVFHGEIGMFRELPRPDTIADYEEYLDLNYQKKKEDSGENENIFKF